MDGNESFFNAVVFIDKATFHIYGYVTDTMFEFRALKIPMKSLRRKEVPQRSAFGVATIFLSRTEYNGKILAMLDDNYCFQQINEFQNDNEVYFQQDRDPSHCVRNALNENFRNKWIGRDSR